MAKVFVPKECAEGETRVAATPETVKRLVKLGHSVTVEAHAGDGAHLADSAFEQAGAAITRAPKGAWATADLVLKVDAPAQNALLGADEASLLRDGAVLIGLLSPYKNLPMVRTLAQRRVTSLAMELVPRISRAQTIDALSSQANLAGYKAVLLAATRLAKYFPLFMTAAGTIKPARVVIMGAGVAGLQALATARRLGALVEVSDIRPEVKEQVESLGGKFIELPLESGSGQGGYAKEVTPEFLRKQQEIVAVRVAAADVVVTTALVPGRPAPKLVTEAMVKSMRSGAVIVDLATSQGGNCELSKPNQEVVVHGVTILGPTNLPATMAEDASNLYARNVLALVLLLSKDGGAISLDLADEIITGSLLTHEGQVRHAPTAQAL